MTPGVKTLPWRARAGKALSCTPARPPKGPGNALIPLELATGKTGHRPRCWSAIAIGLLIVAAVKAWLIFNLPIAAYSDDSGSFVTTAFTFWDEGRFYLHPKRTFLYPLIVTGLFKLPVPLAYSVVWVQHLVSLLAPVCVCLIASRLKGVQPWMLLLLAVATGLSVPWLYYSHYLLADLAYGVTFWIFAWQAWRLLSADEGNFAGRAAWVLLAAAMAIAFRPEGKLLVLAAPGLIGLTLVVLRPRLRPLPLLFGLGLPLLLCGALWMHAGRATESKKLLFCSVLPLVNLESPLLAEYKRPMAPFVLEARENLRDWPKKRHKFQGTLTDEKSARYGPLWEVLCSEADWAPTMHRICGKLAGEAIRAHPFQAVRLSWLNLKQVIRADSNRSDSFSRKRFGGDWSEEAVSKPDKVRRLLGRSWRGTERHILDPARQDRVVVVMQAIERFTSPKRWDWAGAVALAGWLLAIRRNGWRLAVIGAMFAAYALAVFLVARGIPRFLLVFELILPLGIVLAVAEGRLLLAHGFARWRARSPAREDGESASI